MKKLKKEAKMIISSWQVKKIELLAEYMDTLGHLYTIYSEKFPEYQDFWLNLALDNIKYADWIHSVNYYILNDTYKYNMMRFYIESVITGLRYLKTNIINAENKNVYMNEAVALSIGLESGVIALKFFEIVDQNSEELRILFNEFRSEKRENLKKLQKYSYEFKNSELCPAV